MREACTAVCASRVFLAIRCNDYGRAFASDDWTARSVSGQLAGCRSAVGVLPLLVGLPINDYDAALPSNDWRVSPGGHAVVRTSRCNLNFRSVSSRAFLTQGIAA